MNNEQRDAFIAGAQAMREYIARRHKPLAIEIRAAWPSDPPKFGDDPGPLEGDIPWVRRPSSGPHASQTGARKKGSMMLKPKGMQEETKRQRVIRALWEKQFEGSPWAGKFHLIRPDSLEDDYGKLADKIIGIVEAGRVALEQESGVTGEKTAPDGEAPIFVHTHRGLRYDIYLRGYVVSTVIGESTDWPAPQIVINRIPRELAKAEEFGRMSAEPVEPSRADPIPKVSIDVNRSIMMRALWCAMFPSHLIRVPHPDALEAVTGRLADAALAVLLHKE